MLYKSKQKGMEKINFLSLFALASNFKHPVYYFCHWSSKSLFLFLFLCSFFCTFFHWIRGIVYFILGTEYFCISVNIRELCPGLQCDPFRTCLVNFSGSTRAMLIWFMILCLQSGDFLVWLLRAGPSLRPVWVPGTLPSSLSWLLLWPGAVPYMPVDLLCCLVREDSQPHSCLCRALRCSYL